MGLATYIFLDLSRLSEKCQKMKQSYNINFYYLDKTTGCPDGITQMTFGLPFSVSYNANLALKSSCSWGTFFNISAWFFCACAIVSIAAALFFAAFNSPSDLACIACFSARASNAILVNVGLSNDTEFTLIPNCSSIFDLS